jgi:hypothetical protein
MRAVSACALAGFAHSSSIPSYRRKARKQPLVLVQGEFDESIWGHDS